MESDPFFKFSEMAFGFKVLETTLLLAGNVKATPEVMNNNKVHSR